jgi:hypothetical protein
VEELVVGGGVFDNNMGLVAVVVALAVFDVVVVMIGLTLAKADSAAASALLCCCLSRNVSSWRSMANTASWFSLAICSAKARINLRPKYDPIKIRTRVTTTVAALMIMIDCLLVGVRNDDDERISAWEGVEMGAARGRSGQVKSACRSPGRTRGRSSQRVAVHSCALSWTWFRSLFAVLVRTKRQSVGNGLVER